MVEKVNTGGVMSFDYSKAEKSKLSSEQKRGIERGYEEYERRKRRERRKKFIIILLIIVIIFAGLLARII